MGTRNQVVLGLHTGINASAALVVDGELVAAVQEERLAREKNYVGFPYLALEEVVGLAGIHKQHIDLVAIAGLAPPSAHCTQEELDDRIARLRSPSRTMLADLRRHTRWGHKRLRARAELNAILDRVALGQTDAQFLDHHACHADAAYFSLRQELGRPVLVVPADGFGDDTSWTAATYADGVRRELLRSPRRHSLGMIYFWVTQALGMRPHSDEHKIMGLAGYPEHRRPALDAMFEHLLEWDLNRDAFRVGGDSYSSEIAVLRILDALRDYRFDDIAASLQHVTERTLTEYVETAVRRSGISDVFVAGGCFMNVKANSLVATSPEVSSCFAMPSCGDESLSIGAAFRGYAERFGQGSVRPLRDLFLGADIRLSAAVRAEADRAGCKVIRDEAAAAALVRRGYVAARCVGRAEFGARALGNRSLIADPMVPGVAQRINRAIKHRDFWMPFAPAVLDESASTVVEGPVHGDPRFMMFAYRIKEEHRLALTAALHAGDGTARIQAVPSSSPFGRLLAEISPLGVALNTSFNLHGEPMVYSDRDAWTTFCASGVDALCVAEYTILKPNVQVDTERLPDEMEMAR